jgi:hypothetical protein
MFCNMTPCGPLKISRSFEGTYCFHLQQVSCVAQSSTLKMEAIYFVEKSVDFQGTIEHYMPQDRTSNPIIKFERYIL